MEFKSLNELKERLQPALKTKTNELNNEINEEYIWEYLKETKWKNAKGLALSDMVNDILKFNMK